MAEVTLEIKSPESWLRASPPPPAPKAYESTLSSVNTEQIFGIILHALLLALYKVAVQ